MRIAIMALRGVAPGWCLVVAVTLCAVVGTSRDALASPATLRSPLPEVTSKPGRPRGGLLATILPWPESRYSHDGRIRLKLIISNVSDADVRTNLVYQPLADDVRVIVISESDSQRPQLRQAENPVISVLGPPPKTFKPGEIHEYEIPLDRYTPEITKPGSYTAVVRLRVGSENGAAVWLVSNEVQIVII